jgi:hypothetical protein
MNRAQIISEAKKVVSTELKSIKTINSSLDNNFYRIVKIIFETKAFTRIRSNKI